MRRLPAATAAALVLAVPALAARPAHHIVTGILASPRQGATVRLAVVSASGAHPTALARGEARELRRKARMQQALEDPHAPWRTRPASPRQDHLLAKHNLPRWPGQTAGETADVLHAFFHRDWSTPREMAVRAVRNARAQA